MNKMVDLPLQSKAKLYFMSRYFLLIFCVFTLQSCDWLTKKTPVIEPLPEFETTPQVFPLVRGIVDEASGIADSRRFKGNVWIHEDGDNPAAIYLFSHQGKLQGRLDLPVSNRDWEDMTIGPGPETGKTYIYIGEIGDNATVHKEYIVYRFLEPDDLVAPITKVDNLRFVYSDGKSYNAETLMLDPTTKDLYIITKGVFTERIYKLAYPQSTAEVNTAQFVGNTQQFILTAGDISADGTEIVLKNYDAVLYWRRKVNESIPDALKRLRDLTLPYQVEVQGEAICLMQDKSGYFTTSERADKDVDIPLNFYKRK